MNNNNANNIPIIGAPPAKKMFIALEDEFANIKKAKAVIVPVPYDRTTTYIHGTSKGPAALIDASQYLERFDDELGQETFRMGIHTLAPLAVGELSSEEMVQCVAAQTAELLKAGKFPVVLGGEHAISVGAVKAFAEACPALSVLHLDAHYDMRDTLNGSKLNHGCVARRMAELCPVVQVGVRSLSKEEKDFLVSPENTRVKSFSVYDILETPQWKDAVNAALTDTVYISLDLDVLDPAVVPSTGTPEPGGLGWYELLDLLKGVAKNKRIVGFDIMELCPNPATVAPDFLAAKLLYRLLGYVFPVKK